MSEHKHNEHEQDREGRTHHETFAERDPLAAEEPDVLESSASDPEFPAMQEFEVDRGGPKANTRKHPGLIWIIIAIVAVIGLVIAFAANGDWMNPTQAEKVQQTEFEEQTVPEDLGANENPEAAQFHTTCAPKGSRESFAILKHCRPTGTPITVMQ